MKAKTTIYQNARPKLFGLAYRLLGSRMDAEDVVQDAWFKWSEADADDIRDPEAWLVTVVTRLGIDRLRQLQARREDYFGPWLPEPLVGGQGRSAEQLSELASDLSMAFLLALERLGAEERAAFLLREVFDYSYAELGEVLDKGEAACRQMITRARARIREDRPRFQVSGEEHRQVVQRFVDALMREDSEAFVNLLAEEVSWVSDGGGKAVAATRVVRGIRAASRLAMGLARRWRGQWQATGETVNGQPGIMLQVGGRLQSVMMLETDGRRVLRIYSVVNPDKLPLDHDTAHRA
ncbi:MAG: RNA polymerase sigma factor SigJ [Ectothiorhodospiraceae bacterium]|nr:RNA polymerase sigma factor SigJ [Ectothiorhodospiraceae bacterium]MCH8505042.1 RNA polymerase sigma factor SigJ [Ectothiorhodospiraceae bacterium]